VPRGGYESTARPRRVRGTRSDGIRAARWLATSSESDSQAEAGLDLFVRDELPGVRVGEAVFNF
jgi:hypothetical protein